MQEAGVHILHLNPGYCCAYDCIGTSSERKPKADAMCRVPPGQDQRTSCTSGFGDKGFTVRFSTDPVILTR